MRARMIEHDGVVERIERDAVCVRIVARSACGSCSARAACSLAENEDKFVLVPTADAAGYAEGEPVTVGVRQGAGLRAVALAYAGATVVLVAALLATVEGLGWSEGWAALTAIGAVALYYIVLRLCRTRIDKTIHFTITHK